MEAKESQTTNQSNNGLPYQFNVFKEQDVIKAPPALLANLEAQIAQYKRSLITPLSVEQIQQELQNERWEVRSVAIERLSTHDTAEVSAVLAQAFHDEHPFVRMAVLRVLGHREDTSISRSMLARGLQDDDWQVREVAVQVLGLHAANLELVKPALHDENAEVRAAAQLVLHENEEPQVLPTPLRPKNQSLLQTKKEENFIMPFDQQATPVSEDFRTVAQAEVAPAASIVPLRKKRTRYTRLLMLVATLALVVGVLSAAGYSWWNYQVGDPSLYATVNQQQTSNGVTIKITKVYVDEGRTIIAYDIPLVGKATSYTIEKWTLTGSAPERPASFPVDVTFGGGKNSAASGVGYMVQPQFLVPSGSNQLTIHLKITQLAAVQPVNAQGVRAVAQLQGTWDFTFTVPFHHTNNSHIPSPAA